MLRAGPAQRSKHCAPPTSRATAPLALSPTGVTILSSDAGEGVGVYDFIPRFSLRVPGAMASGDYATTINVTIVAGP